MHDFIETLNHVLDISVQPKSIGFGPMILRAVVVYVSGWLLLRIGEHRFLGKSTAFDVVLGIVWGSLLSRSINGSGALYETLAAAAVLIGMHWLFVSLAFHSGRFDSLLNGRPLRLVENGRILWNNMRRAHVNERVLREDLRINGKVASVDEVREADYEPSGRVSVIPTSKECRIVEVHVEEGVQTVRIELT